jgi:signal transduction histidine kinase
LRQSQGSRLSRQRFAASASPLIFALGSGALGFVINGSGFPLIGGAEFVFGSFFSILTATLFGPVWGATTAVIAFSRTVALWGHPVALLCFTGEAIATGWLSNRRNWNPLVAVATYWAGLGIPIALFCFIEWDNIGDSLPVALQYAGNGLLMAGAATLLWNEIHRATAVRQETTRKLATAIAQRDYVKQQLRELDRSLDDKVSARTAELHEAVTAAENANQARNEFLAGMSHELRTPLNAIIGNAALLQEQDPTHSQREALRDIELSGHNLLRLITDVIDITKLDAGMIELTIQPTKIREAADASLRMARDMIERKGLTLQTDFRHHSAVIWGDSRRLKQIISNLIYHVIKVAPANGRIEFTVAETLSPATLHFIVRDFGFGADPAAQLKTFRPLTEEGDTLRRNAKLGLGLTIVKKLAELHGGSISNGSQPGAGHAFLCSLPVDHVAVTAPSTKPPITSAGNSASTPPRTESALVGSSRSLH